MNKRQRRKVEKAFGYTILNPKRRRDFIDPCAYFQVNPINGLTDVTLRFKAPEL